MGKLAHLCPSASPNFVEPWSTKCLAEFSRVVNKRSVDKSTRFRSRGRGGKGGLVLPSATVRGGGVRYEFKFLGGSTGGDGGDIGLGEREDPCAAVTGEGEGGLLADLRPLLPERYPTARSIHSPMSAVVFELTDTAWPEIL